MPASFAIVHHANQYLITEGYDNREGIAAIAGRPGETTGFRHILRLHEKLEIPFNLHISGTLLEALAWHDPAFLKELRCLVKLGLIDLVGSCYGQNIMRFFGPEYNRKQLNEELLLYRLHLGVDPAQVKAFWPPERVWDTRHMAPALRDGRLLNGGYSYVILDDRLLLDPADPLHPRRRYDENPEWNAELFLMHEIEDGLGLIAFPIATRLRRSIPPRQDDDWHQVRTDLEGLLVQGVAEGAESFLALYADDMEKVSGIGEWGGGGPGRYEKFLSWLAENRQWITPVKLNAWAETTEVSSTRRIKRGTFQELAVDFEAGEGYERWYLAPDWAPYRGYFNFAEAKVKEAVVQGGDEALLQLAEKQLLVANWETAWHTPASGPHGDSEVHGHASPWARALTSHSRHAAVTARAAVWFSQPPQPASAILDDVDGDGDMEVVLRTDKLFAVISPRFGGRVVSLCVPGAMVVGNPCDDWNWQEDLNRFMDVPRNHPGAFADVGWEHEVYTPELEVAEGALAQIRLRGASGIVKTYSAAAGASVLSVVYEIPASVESINVEFGLSPDYLHLLRQGSDALECFTEADRRGCRSNRAAVWVRPQP
ncbi:MAG TPA: hypothetical protein VES20_14980, partial [Bryobacteraceae bacterium]|nr:hypothetical protein [Bryobacteraceae bacterium]